jgi:hypothetical protein
LLLDSGAGGFPYILNASTRLDRILFKEMACGRGFEFDTETFIVAHKQNYFYQYSNPKEFVWTRRFSAIYCFRSTLPF